MSFPKNVEPRVEFCQPGSIIPTAILPGNRSYGLVVIALIKSLDQRTVGISDMEMLMISPLQGLTHEIISAIMVIQGKGFQINLIVEDHRAAAFLPPTVLGLFLDD